MMWEYLEQGTNLEAEVVATMLREKDYDNYKSAKYKKEKYQNKDIVILYNKNDKQDISDKNHKRVNKEEVKNEIKYLEDTAQQTIAYLNGIENIKSICKTKYNMKNPQIETIGNFSSRGGIIIQDKTATVKFILNYVDLYDFEIYDNKNKLIRKFEDLFFESILKAFIF